MKRLTIILLMSTILSCSKNLEVNIDYIAGYWEIESVVFPDGQKRSYTYNETIDFIGINDSLTGFRKKLKPNLSGKFTTSKDVETFKIVVENDSLNVYYTTPFATWKETILHADSTNLKVINANKNVYLYKRYFPVNLE
ncbi:MAG: hypothetical protein HKO81_07100 [Flavobacteriaceae bacterium]|nr:hypothetical protein [Flavobacteriaceae bacterium]